MTVGSDSFAGAPLVPYGFESTPTPSAGLTTEPGEPILASGAGRTAWWKFVAPFSERVGIDLTQTITSDPYASDTYVTVFTGDSLGSLTMVAEGDDSPYNDPDTGERPFGFLTFMDFEATAGTTYYVQVALWGGSIDCEYVLRLGRLDVTYSDWVTPDPVTVLGGEGGYSIPSTDSLRQTYVGTASHSSIGAPSPGLFQLAISEAIAGASTPSVATSVDVGGFADRSLDPEPPAGPENDIFTYAGTGAITDDGYTATRAFDFLPSAEVPVDAVAAEVEEGTRGVVGVTIGMRMTDRAGDLTATPDSNTTNGLLSVEATIAGSGRALAIGDGGASVFSHNPVGGEVHEWTGIALSSDEFSEGDGEFLVQMRGAVTGAVPMASDTTGSTDGAVTCGAVWFINRVAWSIRPNRHRFVYHSVIAEPIVVYPLRHKQRDDRLGYSPRNRRPSSRQAGLRNSGYL